MLQRIIIIKQYKKKKFIKTIKRGAKDVKYVKEIKFWRDAENDDDDDDDDDDNKSLPSNNNAHQLDQLLRGISSIVVAATAFASA